MKQIKKQKQSGFTLIEIMVVIVILGVLAGLIVPNVIGKDDQARVTAVKSDIKAISNSLELFKLDNFRYPSTEEGLEGLVNKPDNAPNFAPGGYLKKLPKDPWGGEYGYLNDGSSYELYSFGSDGAEGGEGYASDISSSEL